MNKQIKEGYRLSPQQKRLWLLQQNENSALYFAHCSVLIEGTVEKETLKEALQQLTVQQEILRTTYHHLEGMDIPLQVVNDVESVALREVDLSHQRIEEQTDSLEQLFEEAQQSPFNPEQDPPLRLILVRLSPLQHVLLISLPALSADAAGLDNVVRGLSASYEACMSDETLNDTGMQYADSAEILNELIESDETEAGREFWRQQDLSALPMQKLTFEKPAFKKAVFTPQSITVALNSNLAEHITDLAAGYEKSISVLLLACWQVLLWRLTGQTELIIGTGFDGRNFEGLEELPGLFARYLPLHSSLEASLPFDELLRTIDAETQRLAEWQEYFTWEQVYGPPEESTGPAFFPHCYDFTEQSPKHSANLIFSINRLYSCIDRFNLKLSAVRRNGSLILEFHYDSTLFKTADIELLSKRFLQLLESVIRNPQITIGKLDIVTSAERHQLLYEWNDTHAAIPSACIHQLFEQQVELTPDAIALNFEGEQLSYLELNRRANQLAHYLMAQGVGAETLVGLCVERSVEMVVGMLGVLKAGGAYVPLDVEYPAERLQYMLEDAAVNVLLTQGRLAPRLPVVRAMTILSLDEDWEDIAEHSDKNPRLRFDPEHPAYVIYTSGSTGKPKGVMVPHRALCNHMTWMQHTFPLRATDVVLQKTPFSFDASVWEFYAPLLTGARLVLARPGVLRDMASLVEVMVDQQVSILQMVPSLLKIWLDEPNVEDCRWLREVFCGGESLETNLVERFRERLGAVHLTNLYGPTESCIDTTWFTCDESERDVIPIGRPISNIQIYILDEQMQPVPVGISGELYIGGVGLARGYLNRPALTAERFVPHPFSHEAGARLYRTGDLARWREGELEYLGRLDEQVKVRGYRIEIGEVEAALQSHPAVSDAVVSAREFDNHEVRLVAYLVSSEEPAPSVTQLRSFLEEKLPEYMIPALFIELAELPLTANGKVDRRALPAPAGQRLLPEQEFAAARTAVEELLCAIWAEVLQVERVGIHDNFFALGGDSILSIQVIARAREAGLQLSPKQLFQHQSVAALAALHEQQHGAGASAAAAGPGAEVAVGVVPLTPIQHSFFARPVLARRHWNQAVLLELDQEASPGLLGRVLEQLLLRHDALRMRYRRQAEGNWEQFDSGREALQPRPLLTVALSGVSEEQQERVMKQVVAQAQQSLDLEAGPLLRAVLIERGGARRPQLLVVIHHLVVDTYSWRILLEDLERGYEQLQGGAESVQWGVQSSSYRQWSEALSAYAQSAEVRDGLPYWTAVKSGLRLGRVPVETGSSENRYEQRERVLTQLDEERWQGLQEVCGVWRAQLREVLVAGLARVLSRWTKSEAVVLELEGHGREELGQQWLEVSRTVGWFTTRYPVVLRVERDAAATMRGVKEQLRGVPQGGLGYGLLRYLSEDEVVQAELAGAVAEVSFNYHGQLGERSEAGDASTGVVQRVAEVKDGLRGGREEREHVLEVVVVVRGGVLEMEWSYSAGMHKAETMRRLAQEYVTELEQMMEEVSAEVVADALSPSDFPLANISQEDLDKFLAKLN